MKQNLGTTDRVLRFALAFWWIGPWAPYYTFDLLNWLIFIIAWISLIESFFGYCWLHDALGIRNKS